MRFSPAAFLLAFAIAFAPATADAQTGERPLFKWFAPRQPEKSAPRPPSAPEPRRLAEINLEIAWLADPITFPYYLEARVNAGNMEVRGYVPNKSVREHALRLAQVHASLPVVDAMKEHPSLLVRPAQMAPQELQRRVISSLREALPKASSQLQVQLAPDGKVFVYGAVPNHEDKLAVSLALRRLHGCTSVQNQTQVPNDPAVAKGPNTPADGRKNPFQSTSNPGMKPNDNSAGSDPGAKPTFGIPKGIGGKPAKEQTQEPAPLPKLVDIPSPVPTPKLSFEPPAPRKPTDPFVPPSKEDETPKFVPSKPPATTPDVPSPSKVPIFRVVDPPAPTLPQQEPTPKTPITNPQPFTPPAKTPTPSLPSAPEVKAPTKQTPPLDSAALAKLEKRLRELCPELKSARLVPKANGQVEVEATVRRTEDIERVATRIYTMAEFQSYNFDLKFMVGK